jgi:hypothetical protein
VEKVVIYLPHPLAKSLQLWVELQTQLMVVMQTAVMQMGALHTGVTL